MGTEECSSALQLLESSGWAGLVGAVMATLFIRGYLAKFLEERAKVAATKADIDDLMAIARKLKQSEKEVKYKYDEKLELTRFSHQLRFAALDRRLLAHQEAYGICRHLVTIAQGAPTEEAQKALAQFQQWWSANCLYLRSEASAALYASYSAAPRFRHTEQTKSDAVANAEWEKIIGAEGIVASAAGALLGSETQEAKR